MEDSWIHHVIAQRRYPCFEKSTEKIFTRVHRFVCPSQGNYQIIFHFPLRGESLNRVHFS